MDRWIVLTVVRAATALLILVAIVWQAFDLAAIGRFDATRFFAFFTIQSNLLAAAVLAAVVARGRREPGRGLDLVRGASVVYLTITFFVVILLLQGEDVQVAVNWVDFVVHKLVPVVLVIDWLVDPPRMRLTVRHALLWLAFPLVWVALTLVRGAVDGWYPYPFLDPAHGGYGSVAVYFLAILGAFVVVALVVAAVGNVARSARGGAATLRPAI